MAITGVGAAIGGIAQAAGNVISTNLTNKANEAIQDKVNALNLQIAQEANALSVSEAQKNRDYNTEMSNTEYQRKVADLKAAGINPLYAVEGSGNSASGVSNPNIQTATMQAHKNVAPQIDFGGVFSAINAANKVEAYARYVDLFGNKKKGDFIVKNINNVKNNLYDHLASSALKAKTSSDRIEKELYKLHDPDFDSVMSYDWLNN